MGLRSRNVRGQMGEASGAADALNYAFYSRTIKELCCLHTDVSNTCLQASLIIRRLLLFLPLCCLSLCAPQEAPDLFVGFIKIRWFAVISG